jgi:hypothetical protein
MGIHKLATVFFQWGIMGIVDLKGERWQFQIDEHTEAGPTITP